ncbi:MAG: AMP-binding protein [Labilithrix sp.]|nr:AMP-binding protein [Labilithrix sp.]MCW5813531.1 AMP-binding protein [Labilithrix sp.]
MSLLLERFLARGEDARTAVIDDSGEHSYASLVRRARGVAAALGDVSGDRVAVLALPGVDFLASFYGALLAGRALIVLTPIHPAAELRYYCEDAGVGTVVASASLAKLAPPLDVRDVSALAAYEPAPLPPIAAGAPALQLYTSGTTGKPKGAVLTHANLAIQQELVGAAWGFRESDVLLHSLPLHHMHGLAIALLTAIGAGATARMLRSFDAVAIWNEMARATVFMGVPSMYHRLFAAFDAADDATRARWSANARQLRLATSGSAALPVTLAERWRAVNGKIPLERFGMTEIGVGITNPLDGPRHAGHVGQPLPTVETRIVDDEGEDADTGELWIRGPSVFVGYHQKEAETARAFVAASDGGTPWFRTGDTVMREPSLEGRPFKILGRTSVDILKSGGYKLSALEIEEVLRRHPDVDDVAVVGVPDEAWGERVVACVQAHRACEAEALRAFVKEHLAPYKVPKQVLFFDALPRNALGKVVKPDLVKQLV